jgi:hypothetical protein
MRNVADWIRGTFESKREANRRFISPPYTAAIAAGDAHCRLLPLAGRL